MSVPKLQASTSRMQRTRSRQTCLNRTSAAPHRTRGPGPPLAPDFTGGIQTLSESALVYRLLPFPSTALSPWHPPPDFDIKLLPLAFQSKPHTNTLEFTLYLSNQPIALESIVTASSRRKTLSGYPKACVDHVVVDEQPVRIDC